MPSVIDPTILKKLLRYDGDTGKLFWLPRDQSFFKTLRAYRAWNTRYAGTEAFTAIKPGYNQGYNIGNIFDKTYRAHRVVFALIHGRWPTDHLDHIDGNRTNNRIDNLREVSNMVNHQNMKMFSTNTSEQTGVSWDESRQKWAAQIVVSGKNKHLGRFDMKDEAVAARAEAEKIYGFTERHGNAVTAANGTDGCE